MVTRPGWVLDTGALLAYAAGDETVGTVLADAADLDVRVAVPVLCLLEAYRELEHTEHHLLGPLRSHSIVAIIAVEVMSGGDSAPIIGSMARQTGRLGAAHSVYTAMAAGAAVVTSRPDQLTGILGSGWLLVEV